MCESLPTAPVESIFLPRSVVPIGSPTLASGQTAAAVASRYFAIGPSFANTKGQFNDQVTDLISDYFKSTHLRVLGLSVEDLQLGAKRLAELGSAGGYSCVATNVEPNDVGQVSLPRFHRIDLESGSLLVLSVTDSTEKCSPGQSFRITDPAKAIAKVLSQEKKPSDYEAAIDECSLAIKFDPNCLEAYVLRARVYVELQELDKAMRDSYTVICNGKKCLADALGALALVRVAKKQYADALSNYEEASSIEAIDWIQRDFSLFLSSCPADQHRDGDRAVALAKNAMELAGSQADWEYHAALAAAYAETGNFSAAIAEQATCLRSDNLDESEKAEMEIRLKCYNENRPNRMNVRLQ